MKRLLLCSALLCLCGSVVLAQKFEGLVPTPPMGWNTWNTFAGNINEALIKETADALVASGMRDAGYTYIVLDDAWMTKERDAKGDLVADPQKFPSGMKALGAYLHEKGLKFGIYNCAGAHTCAGFPGGRGHEFQDARLYASWDVDYLKYDWCDHGTANGPETYKIMRDALYAAKRPIVFSLCEWGENKPWTWANEVGNLWRTTGDIFACYDCRTSWAFGWKTILDSQVGLEKYAGPGHWNDPDMLEVGNKGLTLAESRAHFSFWCMLAAPLMAGNDVRAMKPEIKSILTNKDVIAIDQDPLGKQGYRVLSETGREIWAKELSNGDYALCVLNSGPTKTNISIDRRELYVLTGDYNVTDVWTKKPLGSTKDTITAMVESHDVLLLRLSRN